MPPDLRQLSLKADTVQADTVQADTEQATVQADTAVARLFAASIAAALIVPLTLVVFLTMPAAPARAEAGTPENPEQELFAKAGLTRLTPSLEGGKIVVPLLMTSEERCFFADRDALALDIFHSKPGTKLVLTVETITGADGPLTPLIFDITAAGKQLKTGYPVSLSFSRPKQPVLVGLFICKDRAGARRCAGKDAEPIEAILKGYDGYQKKLPKDFIASDKIYFFKPLVVSENGVYFPTEAMTDERYANLELFLSSTVAAHPELEKEIKRLRELGQTLKSRPFRTDGQSIIVRLPGFNPQKCGQPGSQYLNVR